MLTDPQSITYATVGKTLPAIGRSDEKSVYKLNDGTSAFELSILHQFKRRNRVVARLQRDATSQDPLVPAQNILASATVTLTMDFPSVGYTQSDVQSLAKALRDWAVDATLLKMINGET